MAKKKATVSPENPDISDIVGFNPEAFNKDWRKKIILGKDFSDDNLLHIPTGSLKLDWALRRPFLEGSMVEIYAPSGTGKTTIALEVASNAMKMGKLVFYIDLEYKLREAQLEMIEGFDRTNFSILRRSTKYDARAYDCISWLCYSARFCRRTVARGRGCRGARKYDYGSGCSPLPQND